MKFFEEILVDLVKFARHDLFHAMVAKPGESRAAGNLCHRKRSVEAHTVPNGGLGPERWQAHRNGQMKQVLKQGCWWFSITWRSRACNSHYLLRDILR